MNAPRFAALLLVAFSCLSIAPAMGADSDPLFVNLTTDDAYRSTLAITVSTRMFERGHPLTIFFNDRGILVASKKNAEKFVDQQAVLVKLAQGGAALLACPNRLDVMRATTDGFRIAEADLVDGIKVGSPQVTGDALFRDGTKTLSW